jgi:diaminopimelate epimerase
MRLRFSKMQGAGNDFVVLDGTAAPISLTPAQLQRLGDRRFGVGADQILAVERSTTPGIDFRYRIFNGASGDEVEHCGNGARCFVRFVHARGLSHKRRLRVETVNKVLELVLLEDGRVSVNMSQPVFELDQLPFDASGLLPQAEGDFQRWTIEGLPEHPLALLSMGNPHAVLRVDDVDTAAVARLGPLIETHRRFPRRVNVGFMQVLSRDAVRLRVFERDAGETLACGTGACAAVVAGIRLGWLARRVAVQARGGELLIEWPAEGASAGLAAGAGAGLNSGNVTMTGPAQTVFEGEIEL